MLATIVGVDYAFNTEQTTDKLILSLLLTGLSTVFKNDSFIAGKYVFGDGNSLTAADVRSF